VAFPEEACVAKDRINVGALYGALNAEREARGWSWRQLAGDAGVSPSLLSRMANGYRPDADGFMTLVGWLGLSAEQFMVSSTRDTREPELATQLAPLLRARKDLTKADVTYLEEVIQATVRRAKAARGDEP
jgi:transcriptional regulator with XRE-family HTH domain